MATKIYESSSVRLLDDTELILKPLKIKYLREFMIVFEFLKKTKTDEEAMVFLAECMKIAMQQYCPEIKTIDDVEDKFDLPTMYEVLDAAAGIKVKKTKTIKEDVEGSNLTWEDLDLATLEAEVFLLGIWKDYDELEMSLSMPELMLTLSQKRELDYNEKRFLAGIQGIDLDEQSGKVENKWEEMKARAFSGGKTSDPNDIMSYQGANAQKVGFGIGMGLGYEDLTEKP